VSDGGHGLEQDTGAVGRLVHRARRSVHWVWEIARHPANKGGRVAAERRAIEWHWRTRDGGDAVEAIVTVDGRTRLVARPHQFSAVWTIYDGVHEWEELQFCLSYLRPGDHFVDVGANVGVFSTLVGTRIPGVRITAVEPFPPVREDLVANLALNGLSIDVVDSAVSDAAGSATFEVLDRDVLNRLAPDDGRGGDGGGGGSGGGTSITVPVTTLDELVGDDPPALIKIDVEGSELLEYRIEVLTRRQAGEDDLDSIASIFRRGLLPRRHHPKARSKGSTVHMATTSRRSGTPGPGVRRHPPHD